MQQSDVDFTRHPTISAALPGPGQFAHISDALVVRHTFPQGDTGYTIVFDRQSNRAYYNYVGR